MKTIKVSNKEMNEDEFTELKQSIIIDKKKKLLEIAKDEYTILEKLEG